MSKVTLEEQSNFLTYLNLIRMQLIFIRVRVEERVWTRDLGQRMRVVDQMLRWQRTWD